MNIPSAIGGVLPVAVLFLAACSDNSKHPCTTCPELPPVALAESFVASRFDSLGLQPGRDRMDVYDVGSDQLGYHHVRMNQYHDRVRVFFGRLIVHVGSGPAVAGVSGAVTTEIDVNPYPRLTGDEALDIARAHMKALGHEAHTEMFGELVIFTWQNENHLCWRSIVTNRALIRNEYLIDAHTGEVVRVHNLVISH